MTTLKNLHPADKVIFFFLSFLILPIMLIASQGAGISWDEWIQSHYGKLVLKFILTGGAAKDCLSFADTMYLYGGLFDSLSGLVYGILHHNLDSFIHSSHLRDFVLPEYFETRHLLNSLFGFLAIFFTGLLGAKIAGWRAGTLSLIFCFLSPRFFGHSMNNPKDIPFAAAYVLSVYGLCRFFHEMPKPKVRTIVLSVIAFAAALNIKAGGILLFCYLYLFLGCFLLYSKIKTGTTPPIANWGIALISITGLGYLGGLLFWPYGLLDPLHHPWIALQSLSQFSGAQGELLFEGRLYAHGSTPFYYIPKWIFISVPLFIHFGLVIFAFKIKSIFKTFSPFLLAIVLFTCFFPPLYSIYKQSVVYDSWRHFLFIYPLLAVLAAVAWKSFTDKLKHPAKKIAALTFLLICLYDPASFMLRNYPNTYVYFNPIVGGLKGAYTNYETDYWGNCLRQSSEWLARYHFGNFPGQPARIKTDGEPMSSAYYLIRDMGNLYRSVGKKEADWDYWISLSRGIAPEDLRLGLWPPQNTIYQVKADDVALCAVIRNEKKPS